MLNIAFAAALNELAVLSTLNNDNPFRIRAYQNAVQIIEGLTADIGQMSRQELLAIDGIGSGLADKIEEFSKTGQIKELESLKKKYPPGLLKMMTLPGLGPKRALLLFKKLKIDSVPALGEAARRGRLSSLPGLGKKFEENILKAIHTTGHGQNRLLLWHARRLMAELIRELSSVPGVMSLQPAGSLRRGKETVGDLDILCSTQKPALMIERFTHLPNVQTVLAAGPKKCSVRLAGQIQCDLRLVEENQFGAAWQYFTGSKEHNVALRERALRLGYTINEYGLYRKSDVKKKKPLASKHEVDIYRRLGLAYIPPELRENRGEIEAAEKNAIPDLITEKEIKGCFHTHTTASDGRDTLEAMVTAARAKGWEWLGVADHSVSLKIAGGLDTERLRLSKEKIAALNKKYSDIRILFGSEVDILSDGRMDYDDNTLKNFDVVVGSIHSGFQQTEDQITRRLVAAMENPHVDCIGHLSGRLIGRREPYAVNMETVLRAAADTQTALEINGQPERMDLYDTHAKTAKGLGVPVSLSTDAHATTELDYMTSAVITARRGWLEKRNVLNTKTWKELKKFFDNGQ